MYELFGSGGDNDSEDEGAVVRAGEFVVYRTDDGRTEVHLKTIDGTVWLTQAQMAELFQVTPQAILHHAVDPVDLQRRRTDRRGNL